MLEDRTEITSLQSISSNSRTLLRHFTPGPSTDPLLSKPHESVQSLPDPPPIIAHLLRQGMKLPAAERMSRLYLKYAIQLKHDFEQNMKTTLHSYLSIPISIDTKAYTADIRNAYASRCAIALQQCASAIIKSCSDRANSLLSSSRQGSKTVQTQSSDKHLSTFNQDAIPLLEKVFQRNAYPSRDEKLSLALRTGMELKQIHIWFQNKRCRYRRDGLHIPKFFSGKGESSMPSSVLYGSGLSQIALQTNSQSSVSAQNAPHSTKGSVSARDAFYLEHAPHAFPNAYPPVCDYDPFPIAKPLPQLHTLWPRIRSSPCEVSGKVSVDIGALIIALDKLSLQESGDEGDPLEPRSRPLGHNICAQHVGCFPLPVYAPSAPLSALVPAALSVVPVQLKGSGVSAGIHRAIDVVETPTRLSRTSLLERVPRSAPILARGSTHPYVSPALSRRFSKQRRLSPSSSLSSICSDNSSSSIFSSPISIGSPLLTPPQLPVDLVHPAKLSTSALMLGPLPDLDQLFN